MDTVEQTKQTQIVMEKILSRLSNLVLLWFTVCLIWSAYTVNTSEIKNQVLSFSDYKEQCIAHQGKIRHEQWLFGTNVYCQQSDGNETVFTSPDNKTLNKILLLTADRLTFNLFDFGSYLNR
ncbi:hypothetical protein [Hydrogenovibrio marinus]|uniref:Uncharacterized protein n=1 Tax=Hydrogenovibrio marinus TaxID=28885 RepID=A0A066ZM82_HYDMR|nr:hypothetical protein [Hydrogenovibrio marinus]KDN94607.1 hypothetical protein EI16_11935 [Hydrogenovibrio marinus]